MKDQQYEPTVPVYPNPYPINPYQDASYIPPPPPPPRKKAKWATVMWSFSAILFVALLVATGVWFGLDHTPMITQRVSTSVPTKTPLIVPTPTPDTTNNPPYVSGLSSTNSSLFLNSFSQALQYQDVQNVELNTDIQHFTESCDNNVIEPSSSGQCENNWKEIRTFMLSDEIEFSFPQYAQVNPTLTGACTNTPDKGNFYVVGTVDNKGFVLPIPHVVTAVFVFTCASCGSESTWAWKSVYICG
jgi:hypothetical protein